MILIKVIITEHPDRLVLRQLIPEDAAFLFELIEKNRQHLSKLGETISEKYPDLESVEKSITALTNPSELRFGMWSAKNLVGTINLTPRSGRSAEISYWIGDEFSGRDFESFALQALVRYAFESGYEELTVETAFGNPTSERVLEQSGFSRILIDPKTETNTYLLLRS